MYTEIVELVKRPISHLCASPDGNSNRIPLQAVQTDHFVGIALSTCDENIYIYQRQNACARWIAQATLSGVPPHIFNGSFDA
jgi:hypothetical protein